MGRGKSAKSWALIDAAYDVLSEIQPATVRAVCYRLFTMGLIKNMSMAAWPKSISGPASKCEGRP